MCFGQQDIDGDYLSEAEYATLYRLAPNIQNAFEELDKAVAEAREEIKEHIRKAEEAERLRTGRKSS